MANSQLTVERFFAGTNYMEALAKTDVSKLRDIDTLGDMNKAVPESIFNKFALFSYSNFTNGSRYEPAGHFIGLDTRVNPSPADAQESNAMIKMLDYQSQIDSLDSKASDYEQKKLSLQNASSNIEKRLDSIRANAESYLIRNTTKVGNPTASNIITWSNEVSPYSITGFQPYAMTDFAFCKFYGKIPNNRLITIRRYPFPVDDRLSLPNRPQPIPIAQAVTWWSGDTGNELNKIGVMNWGLKWQSISVESQDIDGNEVTIDDFIKFFGTAFKGKDGTKIKDGLEKIKALYAGVDGSAAAMQQVSGYDKKMVQYLKDLYDPTKGPYWNRVFGPVNVIHESTKRVRGMQDGWDQPFTVNFHYTFRSFNGLSPKIVALDLISNFLRLTYNDAQFLGQLGRYFARPGLKFSPTITQTLGNILTQWATTAGGGNLAEVVKLVSQVYDSITAQGNQALIATKEAAEGNYQKLIEMGLSVTQASAIKAMSNIVPELISVKSALSDRPIGEWHLVVGNPMNPILTMGDLICTNCTMKFDEEMGPDDFPTGVTFTVSLRQGKPRDKVAIERMFNLGAGPMMKSALGNPSSDNDTFDTVNNEKWSRIQNAGNNEAERQRVINEVGQDTFNNYRNRIRTAYGYGRGSEVIGGKTYGKTTVDDSLLWLYFERKQDSE